MADRKEFIDRLSEKLGRRKPAIVAPLTWDSNPWDDLYSGMDQDALVDMFCRELELLSGRAVRVDGRSGLPDAIRTFLHENKSRRIVRWEGADELTGLIRKGCEDYAEKEPAAELIPWKERNGTDLVGLVAEADTGVCYAEYGIAETGTVVLFNRGGKGRSVSLLPNNIGIVLESKSVVSRITDVLRVLKKPALEHACINFISGPSRSADIEMSLSIGVHGPGAVTVFVVV